MTERNFQDDDFDLDDEFVLDDSELDEDFLDDIAPQAAKPAASGDMDPAEGDWLEAEPGSELDPVLGEPLGEPVVGETESQDEQEFGSWEDAGPEDGPSFAESATAGDVDAEIFAEPALGADAGEFVDEPVEGGDEADWGELELGLDVAGEDPGLAALDDEWSEAAEAEEPLETGAPEPALAEQLLEEQPFTEQPLGDQPAATGSAFEPEALDAVGADAARPVDAAGRDDLPPDALFEDGGGTPAVHGFDPGPAFAEQADENWGGEEVEFAGIVGADDQAAEQAPDGDGADPDLLDDWMSSEGDPVAADAGGETDWDLTIRDDVPAEGAPAMVSPQADLEPESFVLFDGDAAREADDADQPAEDALAEAEGGFGGGRRDTFEGAALGGDSFAGDEAAAEAEPESATPFAASLPGNEVELEAVPFDEAQADSLEVSDETPEIDEEDEYDPVYDAETGDVAASEFFNETVDAEPDYGEMEAVYFDEDEEAAGVHVVGAGGSGRRAYRFAAWATSVAALLIISIGTVAVLEPGLLGLTDPQPMVDRTVVARPELGLDLAAPDLAAAARGAGEQPGGTPPEVAVVSDPGDGQPTGSGDPASDDPASGDPASGDPASGDPASGALATGERVEQPGGQPGEQAVGGEAETPATGPDAGGVVAAGPDDPASPTEQGPPTEQPVGQPGEQPVAAGAEPGAGPDGGVVMPPAGGSRPGDGRVEPADETPTPPEVTIPLLAVGENLEIRGEHRVHRPGGAAFDASVELGMRAWAQLVNEAVFVGKVSKLDADRVTLQFELGEVTLHRRDLVALVPVGDAESQKVVEIEHGYVEVAGRGTLLGRVVRNDSSDAVILETTRGRVTIRAEELGKVGVRTPSGVLVVPDDDGWLQEHALQRVLGRQAIVPDEVTSQPARPPQGR